MWKKDRSFAIALLFNPINLTRDNQGWKLQVDLRNQSCAIYSNRGKEFLRSKFIPKEKNKDFNCSQETHEFLLKAQPGGHLNKHITGLRWASGGVLPIAKWRNKKWVCLFFRDIEPVGWNIANGGSETKDEYKFLDKIIFREMMEELIICRGIPKTLAHVTHLVPQIPTYKRGRSMLVAPDLVKEHMDLRFRHDNIHFVLDVGPEILPKQTQQTVEVTYHDRWHRTLLAETKNVLISINPLELGAEVVRVGEFPLGNDDCLLDGEVHHSETGDYLVRAPICLLSVDYLKELYYKDGEMLGGPLNSTSTDDRRKITNVPNDSFFIFGYDIKLRKERLKSLRHLGIIDTAEAIRLKSWDSKLLSKFDHAIEDNGVLSEELTYLLPVVWKTLEQTLKHEVL